MGEISGRPGGVGSSFAGYYRVAGRRIEGRFVVTAAERPKIHQATGTTRGGWTRWTTFIDPADGGADVRVALEYELPGEIVRSVLGALTGTRLQRAFHRTYLNLKRLAEADAAEADAGRRPAPPTSRDPRRASAPSSRRPGRVRVIAIPDPSLVVLVGAAGSGKSTFAARHFAPDEVLSSDAFRALLSGDEADQRATKTAFSILHREVVRRLAAGRLVVVDATNVEHHARRALVERARAAACPGDRDRPRPAAGCRSRPERGAERGGSWTRRSSSGTSIGSRAVALGDGGHCGRGVRGRSHSPDSQLSSTRPS